MESFAYEAHSEADTEALGRRLAQLLPPSAVVALNGPLGAGKTRLVQAVAAALGVERRYVSSPTFVLVHEYTGPRPVFHFDAYRLRDEDEFAQLAPDEYFEAGGISFVEWADRVSRCLPRDMLEILIEPTGEHARRFVISARGQQLTEVVEALRLGAGS
ncbi:MAG: tRNA (adenosine(37)-N6)-threonylcarbamoyltransferase complex ATPase subunit type 1 TsaE [Planctomycetaceae bacterium]|nr:tRNA (adenosine(37)-N6)-threonylcarbamoyltransferase complex ATPase subunit type 1 TsaE [Planctomycetaceae bacterium]